MSASLDIIECTDPEYFERLEGGGRPHAVYAPVSKAEDQRAAGMLTTALNDCVLERRQFSSIATRTPLGQHAQEQQWEAA